MDKMAKIYITLGFFRADRASPFNPVFSQIFNVLTLDSLGDTQPPDYFKVSK